MEDHSPSRADTSKDLHAASVPFRPVYAVRALREVGFLTGEASPNHTRSRWGLGGTDLGILYGPAPYRLLFGDSFSSEGDFSEGWRSNLLAYIDEPTCDDVPILTDMVVRDRIDFAAEILASRKIDDEEMTVIPTGGFRIGANDYLASMSVRTWGGPGRWTCNDAGLARSDDSGRTWRRLDTLRWPGDCGFVQQTFHVSDSFVWSWGIPAGRFGDVSLMRVPLDGIEDPARYEYFQGRDRNGRSVFAAGEPAMRSAAPIIPGPCGEPSVAWNPHVGGYLFVSYCESSATLLLRCSPAPEGPFSDPVVLVGSDEYSLIYGGFLHGDFIAEGGRRIGFTLSQWLPTYNVRWMTAELVVD